MVTIEGIQGLLIYLVVYVLMTTFLVSILFPLRRDLLAHAVSHLWCLLA